MNRFVNGGLATNSELYMANVHVERRHDLTKHSLHLQRVASMTSSIAGSRAKTGGDYAHLRNNLNRRKMEEDRRAAIDHENMILLSKMRNIFSRGTTASNSGTVKQFEVEPRSLNQEARRRELERITRENLGIVHRIRSRKPNYSTDDLAQQRRAAEKHLRRISKHGQRRADYFTASGSGFSVASDAGSSAGSFAGGIRPFGSQGRPRRLQALDRPHMQNGLAASYQSGQTGSAYGYESRHHLSTPDLYYGDSYGSHAGTALPQYGDPSPGPSPGGHGLAFSASTSALPRGPDSSMLREGPISCEDFRPGAMRALGGSAPSGDLYSCSIMDLGPGATAQTAPSAFDDPALAPPTEVSHEHGAPEEEQGLDGVPEAPPRAEEPEQEPSAIEDHFDAAAATDAQLPAPDAEAEIVHDVDSSAAAEAIEPVPADGALDAAAPATAAAAPATEPAGGEVVAVLPSEEAETEARGAADPDGQVPDSNLAVFAGRTVAVDSADAAAIVQGPPAAVDVPSPTKASLDGAAKDLQERTDPPLLAVPDEVRGPPPALPPELRMSQRTSLALSIDGEGRASVIIGAEAE